jgi:hypothetical protein
MVFLFAIVRFLPRPRRNALVPYLCNLLLLQLMLGSLFDAEPPLSIAEEIVQPVEYSASRACTQWHFLPNSEQLLLQIAEHFVQQAHSSDTCSTLYNIPFCMLQFNRTLMLNPRLRPLSKPQLRWLDYSELCNSEPVSRAMASSVLLNYSSLDNRSHSIELHGNAALRAQKLLYVMQGQLSCK